MVDESTEPSPKVSLRQGKMPIDPARVIDMGDSLLGPTLPSRGIRDANNREIFDAGASLGGEWLV